MSKSWRAVLIFVAAALLLLVIAGGVAALTHPQPHATPTPTAWRAPALQAPTATPTPTAGWWAATPSWIAPAVTPTPTPTPARGGKTP